MIRLDPLIRDAVYRQGTGFVYRWPLPVAYYILTNANALGYCAKPPPAPSKLLRKTPAALLVLIVRTDTHGNVRRTCGDDGCLRISFPTLAPAVLPKTLASPAPILGFVSHSRPVQTAVDQFIWDSVPSCRAVLYLCSADSRQSVWRADRTSKHCRQQRVSLMVHDCRLRTTAN